MAVFISAVTLASFIKFYGAQFGGEMKKYKDVKEVPVTMEIGEWILAGLTLVIGVFPIFVTKFINNGIAVINKGEIAPITSNIYNIGFGSMLFSPLIFILLFGVLGIGVYLYFRPHYAKTTAAWDCGATEINRDEYKEVAVDYYRWYEEKIKSFYRFADWCYMVGKGIVYYVVKGYMWAASYLVKIVDTPYTKVETISDLRDGQVLYIDEEVFKPAVRFFRIAKDILPGIRLGSFVALLILFVGIIVGLLILI